MSLLTSLIALVPALPIANRQAGGRAAAARQDDATRVEIGPIAYEPVAAPDPIAQAIEDRDAKIGNLKVELMEARDALAARTEERDRARALSRRLATTIGERDDRIRTLLDEIVRLRQARDQALAFALYSDPPALFRSGPPTRVEPNGRQHPPAGPDFRPPAQHGPGLTYNEVNRMLQAQAAQALADHPQAQMLAQQNFAALQMRAPSEAQLAQLGAQQLSHGVIMEICDCTPRGGRAGAMTGMTRPADD